MKISKFYIFTLFLVLLSCKKEIEKPISVPLPGSDPCADFPSIGMGQLEYSEDSIQFKFPTFNPKYKNEIVYNYIDYSTWPFTLQLVKYNLTSKQKQVLVDGVYLNSTPAWSDEGWIAFETTANQIYTVNGDGGSLAPFVLNNINAGPSWSKMDSSLIWVQTDPQTSKSAYLRKKFNQNSCDTLVCPAYKVPIVSNNKILLFSSVEEFRFFDLKTANTFDIFDNQAVPVSLAGLTYAFCWHPTKPLFYACKFNEANFGLYEINYLTGAHRKIMDFCDTKHYVNISCSPDGNYLVGERVDRYQFFNPDGTPNGTIGLKAKIYLVHIASGTETKLDL